MFNSDILDIAMGLIFVYLVLSLFCSAMNELLEGWLKKRSKNLERGIRELLGDQKGTGLAGAIYTHPLVSSLFKGTYDPALIKKDVYRKINLPSYIPSRNFALALMDALLPATGAQASGAAGAVAAGVQPASITTLRDAVANLATTNPALMNTAAQKALLTLLDSAGNDIVRARENIEAWFDSAMDRVAGWYKRRTQTILVVLGFAVAVVMNADTITIARQMSVDKSMRASLVAAAQAYAGRPAPPTPAAGADTKPAECKLKDGKPVDAKACANLPASCQLDETSPQCNLDRLSTLGLPLGWSSTSSAAGNVKPQECRDASTWMLRILGWLLTAFAISLGAPFWFDLLNKISVVRSTVKPREKSPPEKSKD